MSGASAAACRPARRWDRTTTATCPAGHTLACVSGARLGWGAFDCDAGCGSIMSADVERWACSICNHDICDACEPAAAAAADASAIGQKEAACKRLSAAVTAAAVNAVVAAARAAEQEQWVSVLVRMAPQRSLRASRGWGGSTLLLETKPPETGYMDMYLDERKRRLDAQACATAAEQRAAEEATKAKAEQRARVKAEAISAALGLDVDLGATSNESAGCGACQANKRRRTYAEARAAIATQDAEEATSTAAAAKAEAAASKLEVQAAEVWAKEAIKAAQAEASTREQEKLVKVRAELKEAKNAFRAVSKDRHQAEQAAAKAAAALTAKTVAEEAAQEVAQEAVAAQEAAEARAQRAEQLLKDLKGELGIEGGRWMPCASDRKRGLPMLKSALDGRSAADIATALKGAGGAVLLSDLTACQEFQPLVASIIQTAVDKIQTRWSKRLSVLLMSDLQLSREQYEALRHYLSDQYDADDDSYTQLRVFESPFNNRLYVLFPKLVARTQWEPERDALFGLCGVESSADGMVSYVKDHRTAMAQMVADHWDGISSTVKEGRRKMLIAGFGDATGGWRGSSITHFELGICSWEDEDIKQCSKSNLLPAALGEGDDGAENLRTRFQPVADGFDALASGSPLDVPLPSGRREVPVDFTFCGDFQIHKAILGMSKYTSAIWCECDHDTTGMFNLRPMPATTWAEVKAWYAEIGCTVKTLEKVCELNHYSFEHLQGRAFKRFKCSQPGCGYEAKTFIQWRQDMNAHEDLGKAERKQADLEHGRGHKRHRKFMRPMLKNTPPLRMSVDILHILFINLFVTYVEATILVYVVEFDAIGRQPVEAYLASKKIPMKIVKAKDVGEMKESLIGRDAKVFMESAHEIIPELLCFVRKPKAEVQQAAAEAAAEVAADVDTDDFTWDGGEGEGEDGEQPLTLEDKVAAKLAGASVRRVAADEDKGALLDKCFALAKKNMTGFSSAEELRAKRGEIAAANVTAIVEGSQLLAFAAYLIHEREGEHVVTYLLELHRDLSTQRSKGLGSDLEADVEEKAIAADESMMLTVDAANSARGFYAKRGYWIDASSPQNHATASTRPRPVGYLIMRKYPTEGESVHERDARFWDAFYAVTRSFRVFESDTDSYREQRAVEVFNAATQLSRDVKVLRPTLKSACPHILTDIVPLQIVEMGDPLARGCDQSEAIGANMKSTIHRRVARNTITGKATKHTRRDASGAIVKQWTQKALKTSRVMQAFRAEAVRQRILRDPASAPFLQRKHFKLLKRGRASKAAAKGERPDERNIAGAYVKRLRELREEGGEPA